MCIEACPGNLIKKNSDGKAYMLHERDCWGCTSCIKECKTGAIEVFPRCRYRRKRKYSFCK